jgi:hypothetical protein
MSFPSITYATLFLFYFPPFQFFIFLGEIVFSLPTASAPVEGEVTVTISLTLTKTEGLVASVTASDNSVLATLTIPSV